MQKFIPVFIIVGWYFFSAVCFSPIETYVYICDSPSATKYHLSSTCRGLNACEQKIVKLTKEQAAEQGKKTLCGWED